MPTMDGRELYHNIAALHPAMIVLYISGYADTIIADHGILAEGANFLQKPFTVESLTQKVREVLG